MKKPTKHEQINLFFSAFLILGFGICAYFFSAISGSSLSDNLLGKIVYMLIFVVFGLILFYATRVGDGKQVKRLSIATLILVDLPSIYVILAYLFDFMPLHAQIGGSNSVAAILAAFALGYGIPYTFLSGYEIQEDVPEEEEAENSEEALGDAQDVEYSEIKTLDLGVEEESEEDNGAQEGENSEETAETVENDEKTDGDEISEDTAKTIQSILDEKNEK